MVKLLRKVAFGLRTQGPSYLVRAPANEFANPRLPITRALRRLVYRVQSRLAAPKPSDVEWSTGALQFIFDMSVAPMTFDFVSYLAAADMERRRRSLPHMDVLFVGGDHHGVRRELPAYEAIVDAQMRLWRLRNVLVPVLALLPSVRSYSCCSSREQAKVLISADPTRIYPPDFLINFPSQPVKSMIHDAARKGEPVWPMLRANGAAKRFIAPYIERVARGRRPVVISLRNYGFEPKRNSRTEEWLRFANELDPERYAAIFVPDIEAAMTAIPKDFDGHAICVAACWNIEIRMALYEAAWLNVSIMQGPMELCWYNEAVRYAIFYEPNIEPVNSVAQLTENGLRVGYNLDFATARQHIYWQADTLVNIRRAFAEAEATLTSQ
jgi:hypothetical protein